MACLNSLNFSISELCHSDIAKTYGIANTPTVEVCDNLLLLIFHVLQPLREKLGKAVIINSGYRSKQLNAHPKIRGAANSQHLTGQAADIRVNGCNPADLWRYIQKSEIVYDQLILEYNSWVHISYNKARNRMQTFRIDV